MRTLKKISRLFKKKKGKKMRCEYTADKLGVKCKSLEWRDNEKFKSAWAHAESAAQKHMPIVPDIRWRAHITTWAAQNGLRLEGDFVECGVFTGLSSLTICHSLEFNKINKKFFLFDLWDNIPLENLTESELTLVSGHNKNFYGKYNVYDTTKEAFSAFPNCKLIKGLIPDTLSQAPDKIAYLAIDLNNTHAERSAIEILWPRLAQGAMVVIDDYGWVGHEDQRKMWDSFASERGLSVATLPTGQGLLIK